MPETSLHLFDSLTAALQPFVPRAPSADGVAAEVGIYCCGPTVYDVAHVGHARAALAPDVLVRHLRAEGFPVKYVRNVTDVDDKILNRAQETGEQPLSLSARMTALYQADITALGCSQPDVEPKVSEHIADIVSIIQRLIERNAAYVLDTPQGSRDVYYAVRTFEGYGKLSKRKLDDMIAGARVEANEAKRDPADFALWKGCVGDAWGWDSPWGKGRPGWHIECSAMSARHLGHGFDVHCGGMDLIFPHHENEIAQSEAAYPEGGAFCRTWIHNGFVNVDKEKMAKSLGNFVTIKQVYERNDPEALRYFLLSVHYRGPIQFDTEGSIAEGRVTFPGVVEAERRVDYLYQTLDRLRALALSDKPGTLGVMPPSVSSYLTVANEALPKLRAALDDDLNTPVALSVIAEVAKSGNEFADVAQRKKDPIITKLAPYVASRLAKALVDVTERLGLLQTMPADYVARTRAQRLAIKGITAEQIDQLVADRTAARTAKDFTKADQVRAELTKLGIEIFDTTVGTSWRILP